MSTLNEINSGSERVGYDEGFSKSQGLGSKVSNASNWQDLPLEILEMVAKHLQEDPIDLKSFFEISPLTKCSVLNVIHLQAIKELQVLSNLNTSEAKQSSSAIDFYLDFLANIQHPNFELREEGVKIDDSKLQKLQQALTALSTTQVAERLINLKQECYQEISKEDASIESLIHKYTSFKNAVVSDALKLIFDHSVNPRSTKSWAVKTTAEKGLVGLSQSLLADTAEADRGGGVRGADLVDFLAVVKICAERGISDEERGWFTNYAAQKGLSRLAQTILAN